MLKKGKVLQKLELGLITAKKRNRETKRRKPMRKPTSNIRLKPATVELLNRIRGPVTQDYFIAALIMEFVRAERKVSDLIKNWEGEND